VHEQELLPHDPYGLVKCCESLAFLIRDVAHITPYNFENCVHCIRTFVEASLNGSKFYIVITSQVLFHNGTLLHSKVQYTTLDNSSQLF
jgi:hypothetical protein